jgi:hypothetical protein
VAVERLGVVFHPRAGRQSSGYAGRGQLWSHTAPSYTAQATLVVSTAVPEPSTLVLFGSTAIALGVGRRLRRDSGRGGK